ncbi:MAG: chemotaxis protein CheX [Ghiorsea sp.]
MMISDEQRDALCEIINMGVGKAAASLHGMVGHKVQLTVPSVLVLKADQVKYNIFDQYGDNISLVTMSFDGDISGNSSLLFPPASASILVNALTGSATMENEMDALRMGTLTEVGNIILNGVIGTMSNVLNVSFSFSLPIFLEGSSADVMKLGHHEKTTVLVANTMLRGEEVDIKGASVLLYNVGAFDALLCLIDQSMQA